MRERSQRPDADSGSRSSASELVRRAHGRGRAQRFFMTLAHGAALVGLAAVPIVLLWRRGWFGSTLAISAVAGLVILAVARATYAAAQRRDSLEVAVRLDEHSGAAEDVLRTSYELESAEDSAQDPYVAYHLQLHPEFEGQTVSRAYPWRFSAWALIAPLSIVAVLFATQWTPAANAFAPWIAPPPIAQETFVSASTLFERERLEELREDVYDSGNADLVEAFEAIEAALDDLERGVNQREILAQLRQLAEKLEEMDIPQPADLEDALEQAAEKLGDSPEAADLAAALRDKDLERAAAELEKLDPSEAEGADDSEAERSSEADRALRAAADELSPFERSEDRTLQRAERELERAQERAESSDQDDERLQEAESALDQLEQERQRMADEQGVEQSRQEALARALRRLARERSSNRQREDGAGGQDEAQSSQGTQSDGQSGSDQAESSASQSGAEALRQQASEQQAQRARDSLRQRADSLRESVQRDGQQGGQSSGDSQRADDMREFLRRAGADMDSLPRADGQQGSGQQGSGQQGSGQQGSGQQGSGQQGSGQQGSGQQGSGQQGSGQQGSGQQGSGRQLQRLDRNPQQGGGSGSGSGEQGSQAGQGAGQGGPATEGAGGESYGEGHREDEYLNPTARSGTGRDVQLRGTPDGEGPSSAEIILGAEDGGFAGVPYRDVYQRYAEIRESAMERESIPSGYRYYIERYFELISPRTANRR